MHQKMMDSLDEQLTCHANRYESVDSHVMVRNLAISQKYIKWTIFLTVGETD